MLNIKQLLKFIGATIFGVLLVSTTIWAADSTIDKTNAAKGLITVKYGGTPKGIKAMVEKNGVKYTYDIKSASTNIPLQMGTGDYKISVLKNIEGSKYKALLSETINIPSIDERELYTNSIQMVNYDSKMKVISDFAEKLAAVGNETAKSKFVYNFLVTEFNYDFDKAKNVASHYIPVIDDIYEKKKGICYDYASVLAGILRSTGIPTKLVMGYASGVSEYHAWNEINIGGKWVVVDSTTDSQLAKTKSAYTMTKNSSRYKAVKIY